MHLSDGRRRHRLEREMFELLLPALAPIALQHAGNLGPGHGARIGAQARQNIGQRRRQQVAGLHGHQLPYLHGRTAQLGQLVGNPARVGGCQQQVADLGAVSTCPLACSFGHHASGNASGHPAQARQAGAAAAGYCQCGCGGARAGVRVRVGFGGFGVQIRVLSGSHFLPARCSKQGSSSTW